MIIRNRQIIILVAILSILFVSKAFAATSDSQWTVTPRLWTPTISTEDDNTINRFLDQDIDLYGLSIDYKPTDLDQYSFAFSYFTSADEYPLVIDSIDPFGNEVESIGDQKREDLEILVRYQVPNSIVNLNLGYRAVRASGNLVFDYDTETDLIELGVGFGAPMYDYSDRHFLFAYLILGFGDEKITPRSDQSHHANTLDLNLGYQYRLSDSVSLNLRYRNFWLEANKTNTSLDGLEMGVSFRF